MKFLHLADLHIGKKVNDISMIQEQKNALNQELNPFILGVMTIITEVFHPKLICENYLLLS